jgi:hypothetical protein
MCNELTFTAELGVQLQIWDSLSKMSWMHRINIRCRIVCAETNLGFAAEVVLSVANLKFTAKIELFALKELSLPNWVSFSESGVCFKN